MQKYRKIGFLIGLLTSTAITMPALAATDFLADTVTYDTNNDLITARGNIEIKTPDGYFYLEQFKYNISSKIITVEGPMQGVLSTGERVTSQFAKLNTETQEIILRQARILMESQLQVAAQRLEIDQNSISGEQIMASSCQVCAISPTPIWSIHAKQIYQDNDAQKLYFKNARMEILGLPVGYLPTMRVPSNDATRMSGFLRPTLIFSDLYLSGLKIPYYWTLGDHADLKITPYFTTSDVRILETVYRQEVAGGSINVEGAYGFDDGTGETGRYYLSLEGEYSLPQEWNLSAQYGIQSEYDFAPEFNYTHLTENEITLSQIQNQSATSFSITEFRPSSELALENIGSTVVLPELTHVGYGYLGRKTSYSYDLNFLSLERPNDTDVLRISGNADISSNQYLGMGLNLKSTAGLGFRAYSIGDEAIENGEHTNRLTPLAALDLTLPLAKTTANGSHIITPRAQLVWSDNFDRGDVVPNTDALFVENDYNTLFTYNRFLGRDRHETGLRVNLGGSYSYSGNDGKTFEAGLGRYFHLSGDNELADFDESENDGSEWVGFARYANGDGFALYLRGAFDNDFDYSRAEIGLDYLIEDLDIGLSVVSLAPEPEIGFDDYRTEANLDGFYHFAPHWQIDYDLRYDLTTQTPYDATVGLTYGNECIEIEGSAIQDFRRGTGIADETRYEFSVTFIGLGDTPKRNWPRRNCQSSILANN